MEAPPTDLVLAQPRRLSRSALWRWLRYRAPVVGCAVWALVGAVSSAAATSVVARPIESILVEATLAFVGTVRVTVVSRSASGAIRTTVEFADVVSLRDPLALPVRLVFSGGDLDGVRERVFGVPQFVAGERVVVFARSDAHAVSPILGVDQGLFRVVRVGGEDRIVDAAAHPVVRGASATLLRSSAASDLSRAILLDDFVHRARAAWKSR